MRRHIGGLQFAFVVVGAAALVGCGAAENPALEAGMPALVTTGPPDTLGDLPDLADGSAPAHPTSGPHGGDLVELGDEEYHAEVVHGKDEVAIHVLGSDARTAVPIDAGELVVNVVRAGRPEQIRVPAEPDANDPAGKSSRFVSRDADLARHLHEAGATPRLAVTIAGKFYSGRFAHRQDHGPGHEHGHAHGHDHGTHAH